MTFIENYLDNMRCLFFYYKSLGDKAIATLTDEEIHKNFEPNSNNIAILVKHMSGNMLSRWTDFLHSDGEKPWRNREQEFEDTFSNKVELLEAWEKGWTCLFTAIDSLTPADMEKVAYIRNEGHSVLEAMNRQLAHYSCHIGQIVMLAKALKREAWVSLSIPKGQSKQFNAEKFNQEKQRKNFV